MFNGTKEHDYWYFISLEMLISVTLGKIRIIYLENQQTANTFSCDCVLTMLVRVIESKTVTCICTWQLETFWKNISRSTCDLSMLWCFRLDDDVAICWDTVKSRVKSLTKHNQSVKLKYRNQRFCRNDFGEIKSELLSASIRFVFLHTTNDTVSTTVQYLEFVWIQCFIRRHFSRPNLHTVAQTVAKRLSRWIKSVGHHIKKNNKTLKKYTNKGLSKPGSSWPYNT